MTRSVAIFMAIVLAIASAVAVCFGYMQREKVEVETPRVEVSCKDVFNGEIPKNVTDIILTDYQHGKHFVSFDDNGDGKWESVYLPLFPKSFKKLGPTYHAVIAHLVAVDDEQQLQELVSTGQIQLRYDASAQSLDPRTYNRMAGKYPSMQFGDNVLLTSKPALKVDVSQLLILGGGIGIIISLLVGGYCAFMAMLDFLKRRIAKDDADFSSADIKRTNQAGLPGCADSKPEIPVAAGETEMQSAQAATNQ